MPPWGKDSAYAGFLDQLPEWMEDHLPQPVDAWIIRMNAVAILGRQGKGAKSAIPALERVLKGDENETVRAYALESLARIGQGDSNVARALIDTLRDAEPMLRMEATNYLKAIDPQAAAKAGVK